MENKMNIMILDHYAGSEKMGMETRPYYMGKKWVEMGHKVIIVAASFSHLRSKNPFIKEDFQVIKEDGVAFTFVKTPLYTINNNLRRKNVFQYVRTIWKNAATLAEKYHPDVVIASSTYPFDIYPAQKIAAKSGAKLIYEIHDLWPLSIMELHDYKERDMLVKLINIAQKKAVKQSDAVVSILPLANEYLKTRGLTPKKYFYIPNGADLAEQELSKAPRHTAIIRRFREQGKFTVLYLGGFAVANALDEFILAAEMCPKSMFILIGNGMDRLRLKKLATSKNIKNVDFIDSVPRKGVIATLKEADCLYIGAKKLGLYKYGIGMNKIFDYMCSGRPIICGIKASENMLEKAGCAFIIEPEDPDAIAEAVKKVRKMPQEQRDSMGEKAVEYCKKNFNYATLASDFIKAIESIEQPEKQNSDESTGEGEENES